VKDTQDLGGMNASQVAGAAKYGVSLQMCVRGDTAKVAPSDPHVKTTKGQQAGHVKPRLNSHRQGHFNFLFYLLRTPPPLLKVQSQVISHRHRAAAF
jgi:hypothetical protein